MSNGNTTPTPDSDPNEENGSRAPRPKNFAGILLIALVILVVFMVVRNHYQEPTEKTFPQFYEYLATGKVKSIKAEREVIRAELKKSDKKGPNKEIKISSNQKLFADRFNDIESLHRLGNEAAKKSDEDVDTMLLQLERAAREPLGADGRSGLDRLDFAVHRRYSIRTEEQEYLLVQMTQPIGTSIPGQLGGADDPGRGQEAWLFSPRKIDDPDAPRLVYNISLNRLLGADEYPACQRSFGAADDRQDNDGNRYRGRRRD